MRAYLAAESGDQRVDTITSKEITEWQAYEQVAGPLGDERNDQLHAMMAHLLVMVNSSNESKQYETTEFLPPWHKKTPMMPDGKNGPKYADNRPYGCWYRAFEPGRRLHIPYTLLQAGLTAQQRGQQVGGLWPERTEALLLALP
jgi:hypothetical protein